LGLLTEAQAANLKMQSPQQVLLGVQAWMAKRGMAGGWLLLLDYAKAFDSVNLDLVQVLLEFLNFPPQIIRAFEALSTKHSTQVLTQEGLTPSFYQRRVGLRQGCPLSPLLFALFLAPLLRALITSYEGEAPVWAFADDLTFGTGSAWNLQEKLNIVQHASKMLGLTISQEKTGCTPFMSPLDAQTHTTVTWLDKTLVPRLRGHTFRLLGVWMSPFHAPRHMLEQVVVELVAWLRLAMQSPTSWATRQRIVNHMLVPRLAYRLQSCLWADAQLRDLDKKIGAYVLWQVRVL
jgi:hypothetical protein